MKIELLRKIGFKELEEMVRGVPLKMKSPDGSDIHVYKHSNITLNEMHTDTLNPTTCYLLAKNLVFQKELRSRLLSEHGIDTLHLDGALEIRNEKGEVWTLTPPIVEVTPRKVRYVPSHPEELIYQDEVTLQVPIINDGAHRVYLAREMGETVNCVFISGVDPQYPFYAHPNEWHRVKIFDDIPKTKQEKKFYSREDCYALFRDFGVFGSGAPRHTRK